MQAAREGGLINRSGDAGPEAIQDISLPEAEHVPDSAFPSPVVPAAPSVTSAVSPAALQSRIQPLGGCLGARLKTSAFPGYRRFTRRRVQHVLMHEYPNLQTYSKGVRTLAAL